VPGPLRFPVRRPPRRHRDLRPRPGGPGPRMRHHHPAAVHHRRVLQVRGPRRTPGRSPAAHVRRPRIDYESHAVALDRNEPGALLVAAGLGPPAGHALISLLAPNGLRVSEATGADIEHLGLERGHRTLVITRKGGKVVTVPLAPRTARAIDLAIGERTEGPVFVARDDRRLDRHAAGRIVRKPPAAPGSASPSHPTRLGTRSSPQPWRPGCRSAMSRRQPPMRTPGPRCGMTGAAAAWTGTPRTSSRPTSQALPGNAPAGISFAHRSPAGRSCPAPI
jgi:integrase